MAFPTTGVHVAFGYAGDTSQGDGGVAIRASTTSSQTLTNAGTTTKSAPQKRGDENPLVSIVAFSDGWYAIGSSPDASPSSDARDPLRAGESIDRYCKPDDKVAWLVA